VITDTASRTTTPSSSLQEESSPVKPSSQAGQPVTPATVPSTPRLGSHAPRIPHPDEIQAPEVGFIAEGFYVISVGQEVGIFYHWCVHVLPDPADCLFKCRDEVSDRTNGISGAIHKKYNSFQEAIMVYTRNFNRGRIRAVPVPGGPFWPVNPVNSSSPSTSSTSSNSDDLWGELEDLSEEFSRVVFQ